MHALSFPIGVELGLTHGPALTVIMEATMHSLSVAQPKKFRLVAEAFGVDTMGMDPWEASEAAVDAMMMLSETVGCPTTLGEVGADRARFQEWAEGAHANRRLLDNTCRNLSVNDIVEILANSL